MAEVYPIHSFSPNTSNSLEEDGESHPHVITISSEDTTTNTNTIEAWLPITESRKGNLWTCVFHLISSGIGVQALLLPVAFASLGWAWGIISLSLGFTWQLYTIWVLVQLHESVPGTRYSRFLQLAMAAFGPRVGKLLALFPVMYLSGATCVVLIINGGKAMELFFNVVTGTTSSSALTVVEWFLVFTAMAILMAQAPNLNSVAGFSLVAAITGIAYCTLLWALPVAKGRIPNADYGSSSSSSSESGMGRMSDVLNGIGIIMLSFRGHNLVLEIQGTLPSGQMIQSRKTMWRAVVISYAIVMVILFPLAIAGFWAYGNKVPSSGGMLKAFLLFHGSRTSEPLRGLVYLLLLINCLTSYPIYAMPVFDNLELRFVSMKNKPCSRLVRVCLRLFFGGLTFFIAVAFPFLPSLALVIGAVALPVTLAYPCLMWIAMKKKQKKESAPNTDCESGAVWSWNLLLGSLGMALCVLLVVAAVWSLAKNGLHANFFKPE
ncbi:unnamed protein product [Linum trigynum]|uniref:Amino acid transporter transmembrane domain-containing protein n=1 Tax=Linum trigynum TaxID=586398 RepID=A0AAV2DIT7_9ROSI